MLTYTTYDVCLSHRNNATGFRPVSVDYKNFERMLNNASLGNLNRQVRASDFIV